MHFTPLMSKINNEMASSSLFLPGDYRQLLDSSHWKLEDLRPLKVPVTERVLTKPPFAKYETAIQPNTTYQGTDPELVTWHLTAMTDHLPSSPPEETIITSGALKNSKLPAASQASILPFDCRPTIHETPPTSYDLSPHCQTKINNPSVTRLLVEQASTSNRRKYVCKICGKSFAFPQSLTSHKRIHTGEKPFKCNICGMAFRHLTHRKDHVNSHDATYRPHVCYVCGRGFARNFSLTMHFRIHKKSSELRCLFCDVLFSSLADIREHICPQSHDDLSDTIQK